MSFRFDRALVLRNTMLNVLGAFVPLAVSVGTLPRVLSGLGAERYGVLSLALVAVGYFAVLELGLGGATTKYVAEALGKADEESLPAIIWTALVVQLGMGALGALLLAAVTPWLAGSWLRIAPALQPEARQGLYVLCLLVPLQLLFPSLIGVLEGAQRFDLANLVGVPTSVSTSLAIYVGAWLGWSLPGIMALMVVARLLMTLWLFVLCLRVFPGMRRSFAFSWGWFKPLLAFGGWSTAGSIVVPALAYCDRFMLGRYMSLSDVTYYSVAFGIMSRVGVLPGTLGRTLFPAFSALDAADKGRLEELYLRSCKYALMSYAPLILLLSTFSPELFVLWLGPETAARSAPILQLLLFGAAAANLTPMPSTLLLGIGRPDVGLKWYVACLPVNTWLVWLLVRKWGLVGAAWSFNLRAVAEALVFSYFAARLGGISMRSMLRHRIWGLAGCLCFLAASMKLCPLLGGPAEKLGAYAAATVLFFFLSWTVMLDETDQGFIKDQLKLKLRAKLGAA